MSAAHTSHSAGTQSKLDALLFTFIPECLIKTSTALRSRPCNKTLILAQHPILPYFSRQDGSKYPYLQVAAKWCKGVKCAKMFSAQDKTREIVSHIWLSRATCEPCTTTKPSIRCTFKLQGGEREEIGTSKKTKPNTILGKHPLWQSLLSGRLEGRAWCSCTAAPYPALGGLGFQQGI